MSIVIDNVFHMTEPVLRATGTGRVAALTFDDGPHGETTAALLDLLAEHDVPATFCLVGQNLGSPVAAALVRRMVDEGHVLANHAMSYDDLGDWEPARIEADLRATTQLIRTAAGDPEVPVPFFRAPNGSWGVSGQVAERLGMRPLGVAHTIDDWVTQDEPTLVANLRAALTPGELLLAHDGGGDRRGTVAALRRVLPDWLADGWRFTRPVGWDAG
jgi:endo-1,4-beta-xylanase